ncbi:response regulator [Nitrospinaceae bacterium]|nr:response regulator [Nitrospinaceae bacterium]
MTIRILVADDSITIQKIVAMAFENEDAEVEGIGDGQEAFDKVPGFKPDIVLADVDMPGLDGFELCQKIKGNSELANIKVLLLASDFEDFDEGRFKESQAENHISKPFKSHDIVQMVTKVMTGESALETAVLPDSVKEKDDEPSLEELLASVERLSTDSMEMADDPIEDVSPSAELVESVEEEAVPPFEEHEEIIEETSTAIDDDILSQMMQDVESEISSEPTPIVSSNDDVLGEMIQEVETQLEEGIPEPELAPEEPVLEDEENFEEDFEIYAEVRSQKMESLDDLDSAFKEIVSGEAKQHVEMKEAGMSVLGGIVPEPEDLLEKMAPGAFSGAERRPHSSEEIREHLNADTSSSESTRYQKSPNYENSDDRFIKVAGEQVRQILERSLDSSLQKEMSGLSDILVKTIRKVVREITPEIARSIIREEIEKIKKI